MEGHVICILFVANVFCFTLAQNPGKVTYKVTSLPEDPFLMKKASTTGGSQQYEGFVVDILDYIANFLNMSYVLTIPADFKYGSYASPGNWTGMIGELTRGEVDIAAAPLTVTRNRAKVVDFSQPYLEAGLRILIKTSTKLEHNGRVVCLALPYETRSLDCGNSIIFRSGYISYDYWKVLV
ncbi:hypothetical protein CHS0354_002644 [Potamilus streckersoni]|uniref:Uncharacterized protein n=1 Tax=Potamilus streckersoni TaxID=2493646 RepID=A0AAE0RPC8_9BIVA|nr:hypothetical protein CHS0354_002644 [Potamilus streckersoni]